MTGSIGGYAGIVHVNLSKRNHRVEELTEEEMRAYVGGVKLTPILDWFDAVTGWETSQTGFLTAGERIYNLKRMYNVRCGITGKDDVVRTRMLREKRRGWVRGEPASVFRDA